MGFFGIQTHKGFDLLRIISSPNRSRTASNTWRAGLSLLALASSLIVVSFGPALGQEKRCECKFADPKWQAFGTKAACTAFTGKGRTSCEIAFGGLGTDPNVVRNVLGVSPAEYQTQAIDVLRFYLELIEKNNRVGLADPKLIRTALPIFMRGAYLRSPEDGIDLADAKHLDSVISEFFDKYTLDVSQVFAGKKETFFAAVNETKFEVGRGYVLVDDPSSGRLVTVYMPAEQ